MFLITLILCATGVYAEPAENSPTSSTTNPFESVVPQDDSSALEDSQTLPADDSSAETINPATLLPDSDEQAWAEFTPSTQDKCDVESDLTPTDTQNLLDLLRNGFLGEELRSLDTEDKAAEYGVPEENLSEADKNAMEEAGVKEVTEVQRKTSPNDTLIIPDEDNKSASEVTVPTEEIYPIELTHLLNNHLTGAYAFGIVLNDSLRAARCTSLDANNCAVNADNLKYRNSGAGIVSNVTNVWNDLRGNCITDEGTLCSVENWFTEKKNATMSLFGKEVKLDSSDLDAIYSSAELNGEEQLSYSTIRRIQSKTIPNRIKAEYFNASMSTNCEQSTDCYINTYSLFDKYFNSWSSADFTFSTLGPAMLNSTKRLFNLGGRTIPGLRAAKEQLVAPLRQRIFNKNTFWGQRLMTRLESNKAKYGDIQQWWHKMVNDHRLMETSGFSTFWGDSIAKGGILDSLKTLEEKKHFSNMLSDLRTIVKANYSELDDSMKRYTQIAGKFKVGSAQEKEAVVEYGRSIANYLNNVLDSPGINMDGPEWVMKNPFHGFYNKGVRQLNSGEVINMNEDPRHLQRIFDKFINDGDFTNFADSAASSTIRSAYETDELGRLVLYGVDPSSLKATGNATFSELSNASKLGGPETFVKDQWGQAQKLTPWSADFVQRRVVGDPVLYQGDWAPVLNLSPEDLARRLNNGRLIGNLGVMANSNVDMMIDTLRSRNFIDRKYWSLMDKMLAEEAELMKSYFGSLKGAAKWTFYPFVYRYAKQGFGMENFSHYMLPDSWTSVRFVLGRESIYNDAYIDFFAREGSDDGDIFAQVLNYLPWKKIADTVSENFFPLDDMYKNFTGQGKRSETEDLVYYLNSPVECTGCSLELSSDSLDPNAPFNDFTPSFINNSGKFNSYIMEYTKSAEAKKSGQTLIAFAHHMDLDGDTGDIVPDEEEKSSTVINIAGDINKSCDAASKRALAQMPGVGTLFEKIGLTGSKTGLAIAGMENLSYLLFGMPGITASVFIQTQVTPELQDCIDSEGGYYVQYFASAYETETKDEEGKSAAKLSTDSVLDFVDEQSAKLSDGFKSENENSLTSQIFDKMESEINNFVKSGKSQDNVQAFLSFTGKSHGTLETTALFYLWVDGKMTPSEYRMKGGVKIKDKTTGKTQVVDFKEGVKTFDGKTIVSNPDALRMLTTNTAGPFEELPHYLNEICLIASDEPAMEINAKGEAKVLNSVLANCLKDAIMHQTGLPLENAEKLQDALGKVTAASTLTHPNIAFSETQIVAEGFPPFEGSALSKFVLLASMQSKLVDGEKEQKTGLLQSIQFENAIILLKPNGCMLLWVQHHKDGILNKELVNGIKPKLTEVINPITDCPEPAIDLSMIGNTESPLQISKVEKFNTSLEKMGPFQVFETPTKRYIFWANEAEDCKPYLRVIDKETGEITDIPINNLQQTDSGIKFTDDDGKEHSLDFTVADDGTPLIALDKQDPETLISAQGPNGSFWFDPETGNMYAENGQLLPLMEAFRKGIKTEAQGGEAVSTASGNTLNVDLGKQQDNLLDLPALPENLIALITYLLGIILIIALIRKEFD